MNMYLLIFMLLLVDTQAVGPGTRCTRGDIRLRSRNTPQTYYGRVELCNGNNQWGTVCHDKWDNNEAEVVCRQLGFIGTAIACRSACFGRGRNVTSRYRNFRCSGTEAKLIDCTRTGQQNTCLNGKDAGVVCANTVTVVQVQNQTVTVTVHTACRTSIGNTQCPQSQDKTIISTRNVCQVQNKTVTVPIPCSVNFPKPEDNYTQVDKRAKQEADRNPAQACMTVLGTLGTLMGISLAVVITGWVWTCWTAKRKRSKQISTSDSEVHLLNGTGGTLQYQPANSGFVRFRSAGPMGGNVELEPLQTTYDVIDRDKPQFNLVYSVLQQDDGGVASQGRELATAYEVPVPMSVVGVAENEDRNEYSQLKHL